MCRRRSQPLLLPDRSGHVGDQDVSAQIVQPSDALGATDPLAQRTPPRLPASTLTVARAREQATTTPITPLPSWNATSRRLVAGETAGSSPTGLRPLDYCFRDARSFVKREVSFLAGRCSFLAQETSGNDLSAERAAACVDLCSSATNNRVGLRVCFPARGEQQVRDPRAGRVPLSFWRVHTAPDVAAGCVGQCGFTSDTPTGRMIMRLTRSLYRRSWRVYGCTAGPAKRGRR